MDNATKTAKHWGCPHCGSTRLAHMERAIVLYPVKIVDNPGRPGDFLFEYTGDEAPVDDESAEDCGGPDNYHCSDCGMEFPEPELTDNNPDDDCDDPAALASDDAALDADGEAEATDEGTGPTGQALPTLGYDDSEAVRNALWPFHGTVDGPQTFCRVAWVGQIDKPDGWNHRARLDGAKRALELACQIHGGRVCR